MPQCGRRSRASVKGFAVSRTTSPCMCNGRSAAIARGTPTRSRHIEPIWLAFRVFAMSTSIDTAEISYEACTNTHPRRLVNELFTLGLVQSLFTVCIVTSEQTGALPIYWIYRDEGRVCGRGYRVSLLDIMCLSVFYLRNILTWNLGLRPVTYTVINDRITGRLATTWSCQVVVGDSAVHVADGRYSLTNCVTGWLLQIARVGCWDMPLWSHETVTGYQLQLWIMQGT